jgi:limonene-1,2-epoxide hydrolase
MEALTRRTAFLAGALGAAATGMMAPAASAAPEPTGAEAANVKVVKDFCATWSATDFDPDASVRTYFAPDASVRVLDTMPFVVGQAAIGAAFKPFLQHGERFKVQFLDVYTKGPLVVAHRIDTQVAPGQADKAMELVGVFLVRQGRIKEWTDYLVSA